MGKLRARRLRLFRRGNTRCPICLQPFSEFAVRHAQGVALEHVPPRSLKSLFQSFPMCLTCKRCNWGAGQSMEQDLARMARPPRATMLVRGRQYSFTPEILGERKFRARFKRLWISPRELLGLRPGEAMIRFDTPNERLASVALLKAAYLSLFSLFGEVGYGYAYGSAVSQVREQILNPGRRIIDRFIIRTTSSGRHSIFLPVDRRHCWAVRFGKFIVLLPMSSDTTFYNASEMLEDGSLDALRGYVWDPVVFGANASFQLDAIGEDELAAAENDPLVVDVIVWPSGAKTVVRLPQE